MRCEVELSEESRKESIKEITQLDEAEEKTFDGGCEFLLKWFDGNCEECGMQAMTHDHMEVTQPICFDH